MAANVVVFFLVGAVLTVLLITMLLPVQRPPTIVYVMPGEERPRNGSFGCLPLLIVLGAVFFLIANLK